MKIALIITDIDGVWTDGSMYYTEFGDEFKRFNTSDSVGILLAREAGIPVVIMTGENSKSTKNRAKKLNTECLLGVKDKLTTARALTEKMGITLKEVAFIGDEINDIPLLKAVGLSGCPASAPDYTHAITDISIETNGGFGAFRDFVIHVLKKNGQFKDAFNALTKGS